MCASSGLTTPMPYLASSIPTASRSTSAAVTVAPASRRCPTSGPPTLPTPTTTTWMPSTPADPNRWRTAARIAWYTPNAVDGLGSPLPPALDRQPADVRGRFADHRHVIGVRAHVRRGDVPTTELSDEPTERTQHVIRLVRSVDDRHRLSAAEVVPRHCGLVRHPLGETEHVVERARPRCRRGRNGRRRERDRARWSGWR